MPRTVRQDYEGIIDVYHKLKKAWNKNALPKDPHELVALEKKMIADEALRIRAIRARENIKTMREQIKARKAYARKMRRLEFRWKVDRMHRGMQKFIEKIKRSHN